MKAVVLSMSVDGWLALMREHRSFKRVAEYLANIVEDEVDDLRIAEVKVEQHRVKLLLTSETFPECKGWKGVDDWVPKWKGAKQEAKP